MATGAGVRTAQAPSVFSPVGPQLSTEKKIAIARELTKLIEEAGAKTTALFEYRQDTTGNKQRITSGGEFLRLKYTTPKQKKETRDAIDEIHVLWLPAWHKSQSILSDESIPQEERDALREAIDKVDSRIEHFQVHAWGDARRFDASKFGERVDWNTATRQSLAAKIADVRNMLHGEFGFDPRHEAVQEDAVIAKFAPILGLLPDDTLWASRVRVPKPPQDVASTGDGTATAGFSTDAVEPMTDALRADRPRDVAGQASRAAGPTPVEIPEAMRIPPEQVRLIQEVTVKDAFPDAKDNKNRTELSKRLSRMNAKVTALLNAVEALPKEGADTGAMEGLRKKVDAWKKAQSEVRVLVVERVSTALAERKERIIDDALKGQQVEVSELTTERGEDGEFKAKVDEQSKQAVTKLVHKDPDDQTSAIIGFSAEDLGWVNQEATRLATGKSNYNAYLRAAEELKGDGDTREVGGETLTRQQLLERADAMKMRHQELRAAEAVIRQKRAGVHKQFGSEEHQHDTDMHAFYSMVLVPTERSVKEEKKHAMLAMMEALGINDGALEPILRTSAASSAETQQAAIKGVLERIAAAKGQSREEPELEANFGVLRAANKLLTDLMTMPELKYQLARLEPESEDAQRLDAISATVRDRSGNGQ